MDVRGGRPAEGPMREWLSRRLGGSYTPLVAALSAIYLAGPLLVLTAWSVRIADVLFATVIVAGVWAATRNKALQFSVMGLALLGAAINVLSESTNLIPLDIAAATVNMSLIALTCSVVLSDVMRRRRVTADTIMGAICVYALIALIWGLMFEIIYDLDPTSFNISFYSTQHLSDFLYFSMITITTVGYGDITPQTTLSRNFVAVEALFGTLYLVVLVSHLVSMRASQVSTVSDE